MIHFHRLLRILSCMFACLLMACASGPAQQSREELDTLKTGLVEGERVLRVNSCSLITTADISLNFDVRFGGCYLTNLRFIFEDSDWYKTFKAASKLVPVQGDFGISEIYQAGSEMFNAYYVIEMGNDGRLGVVVRDGRVIVPLAAIESITHVVPESALIQTLSAESARGKRVYAIRSGKGEFLFEIYDLPPHKTGWYPTYITSSWQRDILATRDRIQTRR